MHIKPIYYGNDASVSVNTSQVIRRTVWVATLQRCPATINPFQGKCSQYLHGFPHPPKKMSGQYL